MSQVPRLRRRANQKHFLARLAPEKRGVSRSSRTLSAGCDGRFGLRHDEPQAKRMAKSCGPDISTLISSRRDDPPAMVARKPDSPRRARRKPLKPFARGMPGEPV